MLGAWSHGVTAPIELTFDRETVRDWLKGRNVPLSQAVELYGTARN
jgi:hypothetical protein